NDTAASAQYVARRGARHSPSAAHASVTLPKKKTRTDGSGHVLAHGGITKPSTKPEASTGGRKGGGGVGWASARRAGAPRKAPASAKTATGPAIQMRGIPSRPASTVRTATSKPRSATDSIAYSCDANTENDSDAKVAATSLHSRRRCRSHHSQRSAGGIQPQLM